MVGAGAAGGWAAKELCEAGLEVLLLDAGPRLDPRSDFPVPAPPERRLLSRIASALAGQPIQMRCSVFNSRTRRLFVRDRQNPYTTPAGKPFNWFRGRQVGGRLHLWARVVPRMSDLEFGAASRDGHGVDWPLRHRDLAPHYARVESFLGVRGEPAGLEAAPEGRYASPIPLTPAERAFKSAVESAFPERRVVSAPLARPEPERMPATIRAAEATGRLVLRPNAVVREVQTEPLTGKATGVSFVDRLTGRAERAGARVVVLCASSIETVRIMLNSRGPAHPGGLGNSSGRLGRGLMDHVLTIATGPLLDRDAEQGPSGDPYDLGRTTGIQVPRFQNLDGRERSFMRGYGIQGGIGRDGASWYLLAQGEMMARPENRVTLDPGRTDAWGIPVAHISCVHSRNEVAMATHQIEALREMTGVAGLQMRSPPASGLLGALAFTLWRRRLLTEQGAFLPGSAVHEIGGAAMGRDPRDSVLNPFGQCWDAENVFVTDGAAFTSGCWQNVTLTIMALTVRTCEHIARECRAGRL